MADNPLAALEKVRGDVLKSEEAGMSRDIDRVIYTHGLMTGTSRRLLGALEAVLKAAADAKPVTWDFGPDGMHAPVSWDLDPAAVREAITRELTGEAASDG